MSDAERVQRREEVREMFTYAYDKYMQHAYPAGELRPISCTGGDFGLSKLPMVTLVGSLDTLAVMGNHSEFTRAVDLVGESFSLNLDVNVSLFETNIRILGASTHKPAQRKPTVTAHTNHFRNLPCSFPSPSFTLLSLYFLSGGLLSAHLLASDTSLHLYRGPQWYAGREEHARRREQQRERKREREQATQEEEEEGEEGEEGGGPSSSSSSETEDSAAALGALRNDRSSHGYSNGSSDGSSNGSSNGSSDGSSNGYSNGYSGALLSLAHELGGRLLPAFDTPTGIPYGTVNLRHGVPVGETPVASTAGAGSLAVEFAMLSVLLIKLWQLHELMLL